MKKLTLFIFLIPAFFLFVTCRDPIFYNISQEEELLDPKIQGSPTNFAFFNGNMYVASGQYIYKYNGTAEGYEDRGAWEETSPGDPKGRVFGLAATNDSLYALFEESGKSVLRRTFDGKIWRLLEKESNDHNIRSIHSINDVLFIGAGDSLTSLYILYCNDNDKDNFNLIKLQDTGNLLLNGAAYDNGTYYLSAKDLINTAGGCIYSSDLVNTASLGSNIPFVGIINIDTSVIYAIDQNGKLYNVPSIGVITDMGSYLATGALSIWENEEGERLLLAGRKDIMSVSVTSGYTYGYLELNLTNGGRFIEPGIESVSTESNNGRYRAGIGKLPINHIAQSSTGADRILFASTQKNGVWSRRQRSSEWKWNAEQ